MKKKLGLFIFNFIVINFILSQDVLLKKDGTELKVKVAEISQTEVKYKDLSNLEGPLYILNKSEVTSIKYQNGNLEIFDSTKLREVAFLNKVKIDTSTILSEKEMYKLGQLDASKNYYKYQGAATGTLIASLVSPIAGLIPAIACASSNPVDKNLNYPNLELTKNTEYVNGYKDKAKTIKINKIWKSWAFGLGANIAAYILFVR